MACTVLQADFRHSGDSYGEEVLVEACLRLHGQEYAGQCRRVEDLRGASRSTLDCSGSRNLHAVLVLQTHDSDVFGDEASVGRSIPGRNNTKLCQQKFFFRTCLYAAHGDVGPAIQRIHAEST
jgi:hypothetical protein